LKTSPEDFQVEEVLGFEPSGEGEHCYAWVEKRGWNSNDVAGHFADQLGIRKRLIAHCGLKDKEAVTRQWFSIHLPGAESPTSEQLETDGIRVLRLERGTRKLKRGSHDANRFLLRLREVEITSRSELERRWEAIRDQGVPNYFGPQRFGRNGGNLPQVRKLFRGEIEVRDRLLRGILISSARSALFNLQVARRIQSETWNRALEGEVYGFADNGSLILPERYRGDEEERFAAGRVEVTAPLWGAGELLSAGAVGAMEEGSGDPELAAGLEALGLRQERRVMRLRPQKGSLRWTGDGDEFELSFNLPKGCFATAILSELIDARENQAR